ncbi:hypothetical protein Ait01nite_059490 [Actinoplanes italicus]|uniref:amidohydrolase family protein n=1 Tax=Actinoplanes italicus TaxID=113567 RepID=UPI001A5C0011|nr:amidohydrolase [Actinoplanes italicus]GIE32904.1 hypothetical protein Ait01nite_059490 [Actinoplanes italicus]
MSTESSSISPDVCENATAPFPAAGGGRAGAADACCGGSGSAGACGLAALRRNSTGPRPTVTVAEETEIPPTPTARGAADSPTTGAVTGVAAGSAAGAVTGVAAGSAAGAVTGTAVGTTTDAVSDPAVGSAVGAGVVGSTAGGGAGGAIGKAAGSAARGAVAALAGGNGRVEWLLADSVWWGGRLRKGVALRVAPDGVVKPVPAELAPGGEDTRRFPGTLLPGLVDAHVHSALVDLGTVRAGGIAEVWDLGGVPSTVAEFAGRAVRADSGLPRVRYAGPFLTAPGGYPSDRPWAPAGSWREIGGEADARAAVDEAGAAGARLIKVTAHAGGPRLPLPVLKAVVKAAHAADLPVVVHAEGPGTVAEAYAAGADVLAHTPWTEPVDDALLRACAERMSWISTLDIHGWGDPDPAREVAVGNLRRFIGHGGTVRYGTDLGNGPLPLGVNAREIRLLQSAGLTPDAVLTAMTESDSSTISWLPAGLDLDVERFPDALATARVLDASVRPRQI